MNNDEFNNNMNPNMMNNNGFNNVNSNMMNNNLYGPNKYKLILKRQKSFIGSLVAFRVYVDNVQVGKIKNGKTLVVDIESGQHEVSINKMNPVSIMVSADTTADVVIFGANNFGIDNINGQNGNFTSNNIKSKDGSTNAVMIASVALPIVSVVMYLTMKYVVAAWIYGILIGYCIVNIYGLKNLKMSDLKLYNSLLIKNIVAIVISVIALIVTLFVLI